MKTVVIIDDEKNSCEFLEGLVTKYFSKELLVVKSFTNSIDALEYLNTRSIDLVLLDVQMPQLNGIELLRLTAKKGFHVIFTTAHSEYAIESIKLRAFDYLLKPISIDEFVDSINRFLSLKTQVVDHSTSAKNLSLSLKNDLNRTIAINHQTGVEILYLYDIQYAIAEENYSNVILFDGRRIKVSKPLKWVEEQLNSSKFFRCHKSYLVNLYYVQRYNKLNQSLELTSGSAITVSERKKEMLLDLLS